MSSNDTDYYIITNLLEIEEYGKIISYGIRGICTYEQETREHVIHDVSVNYSVVHSIWKTLVHENVALVHMQDVVEDSLYESEEIYV